MKITIREATLDDVDAIVEMSILFMSSTAYGAIIGTADPRALARTIATVMEHGVILLAELERSDSDGRDVIGMLAVYIAIHPFTGAAYGDELAWWVNPEHRHGRAGYYLLRTAEEWARQNKLSVLKMVAPAGSRVGDFYTRLEYTFIESVYQLKL